MSTTKVFGWGGLLSLAGLLTGCDWPAVVVNFASPFPANSPNLSYFPARHQGKYVLAADTTITLLLEPKQLIQCHFWQQLATRHQLDSLGLVPRTGQELCHNGQQYQVQALAADAFRLRWAQFDTLVRLGSQVKLRHYRDWYYLSTPNADSATWTVQRFAVVHRQLFIQYFNPDSLRLRVLDSASIQRRRDGNQLIFTFVSQAGRATRQVAGYDGLWLPENDYAYKVSELPL